MISYCACLTWCDATGSLCPYEILGFIGLVLGKMETLLLPNSKDPDLGYHPSVNPHQEKLSQLQLNHEKTDVCFLHIQLIGTNVWLPKMHKIVPDVDFDSLRSAGESESWNNPNLHCCAVCPT